MTNICPACAHKNEDGAKHCTSCGTPLSAIFNNPRETTIAGSEQLFYTPGDLIDGRYIVVKELGRGGMGIVCLVRDAELNDRELALKIIHPRLVVLPEARSRFKEEVSICLDLNHPAIIRVYHFKSVGEQSYFTMEYLPGHPLSQIIKERKSGPLPLFTPAELRALLLPLLDGLVYAHRFTVHRDIKPDNIMVQGEFPEIKVKLLDFGIARTMSTSRFTQSSQGLGSTAYVAPEQLEDASKVDGRADVYALGAVIYELLTGEKVIGVFDFPGELIGEAYQPLDAMLRRTLSRNPERRPADMGELKRLLEQSLGQVEEALEAKAREVEEAEEAERAGAEEEEKRRRAEAAEQARKAEEQRKQQERKREEAAAAERERQRLEEEAARQAEEEKRRKAAEEGRRREEERKRKEEEARRAKLPKTGHDFTEPTSGIEMVWVPPGEFDMGDTFSWDAIFRWEKGAEPVHRVSLDGFWMGRYPVTQGQYSRLMGKNPAEFQKGDDYPVEQVSWDDAQEFVQAFNSRSGLVFALPSEAQWEYAARSGGKRERYAGGQDVDALAWYDKNSGRSTHPVGKKRPNGLGLYDMSGNVCEWCADWYGSDYYQKSPKNNPVGPSSGTYRVFRGGSWFNDPGDVRAAYRDRRGPVIASSVLGFRLVLPVQ